MSGASRSFPQTAQSASSSSFLLPTAATGLAKTPLPDNADLAAGSALAVTALVDQAAHAGGTYAAGATSPPVLNVGTFSGIYRVVPPHQRLVRVLVKNPGTALEAAIGDAGVPVPTDIEPQPDSDSVLLVYQPGVIRGPGWTGVYYEFWQLHVATGADATNGYAYTCDQMMRMVQADDNYGQMYDIISQVGATYDDPASDDYAVPDQRNGATQYNTWGVFSIGANPPAATLLLHPADIERGYANHPLRLLVSNYGTSSVFPANGNRHDGEIGGYPFQPGAWFRFAHDAVMPGNLSPMGEVLWRSVQRHGAIATDKTRSCLAMSANPDVAAYQVGPSSSMDGRDWTANPFLNWPWANLQMLAVGNYQNFHPVTG